MSRPMRFPSRGGRVLLLLFGITLGPLLLILPASVWLAWTLTPLEKFYLGTYTASSVGATQPRNTTSIRWVLKTAPGRKSIPMLPQDAVAGPNGKLPVSLSAQAVAEGWRGVALGSPERVPSSQLAPLLRDLMYDGESFPRILGVPLLYGLVGLILLCLALQKGKDAWGYGLSSWAQRRQEKRHGRRTKGPELSRPAWLRWRGDAGIRLRLQGESMGSKLVPWGRSYAIPKRLESSHIMLMGDTGSGKTRTLAVIREGAEAEGYKVEGFAPTSRAAQKLGEAGIETSTLQMHLARRQGPDTGERRLYVLDESSLASTRQMHEFVTRLHPNDRVLLVGDRRQHEAVEAGKPFAQLQEAGMKTISLDQIVRQKEPELRQVVEQLARGEVEAAVKNLDSQSRVHEFRGREERIDAIAKEYAKSPENTLVVSPDNRSRAEINQRIHVELQGHGVVGREEHRVDTLVPRQDLTGAARTWAERYERRDFLLRLPAGEGIQRKYDLGGLVKKLELAAAAGEAQLAYRKARAKKTG